ncbi:MAG: PepSY domain-containing protein [Cyanobacteria bacterium J06633_8]
MKKQLLRKLHLTIAPVVILPLLITVSTGVVYRISKDWFGLSRNQVHFLMVIHEGEYLGKTLEPVYVLLNGLGLLWMLATGGAMLLQNFKNLNQANKSIQYKALDGEVETSDGK